MNEVNEKIIFDFFDKLRIKYSLFRHSPVFTTQDRVLSVESGQEGVELEIPGQHFKSLFLRDKKGGQFYLVTVVGHKRVDFKALGKVIGSAHLSFGSPEQLMQMLKITPGSVSPYCLLFDKENKVKFFIDQDYENGLFVNFHPLRNDMTVGVLPQDFLRCIAEAGHEVGVICVPEKR